MITDILLLILGFVLLIKGADVFVDGVSSTASNFKISKLIIGLTIVAFGTSAPELAVSIKAMLEGSGEIVLGNVIGSNIVNVLLILGITSLISPMLIRTNTIKKELPTLLLITTALVVMFCDSRLDFGQSDMITRSDGIIIILFFMIFIYYLMNTIRNKKQDNDDEKPKYKIVKSILLTIIGLVGILIGSDLVVDSAVNIATALKISEKFISLTIIAIGTSLPELITSVAAAIKKENDIAIGNIIGSNIFNICLVLGVPVALFGGITPHGFLMIDLFMLFVSSLMLCIFASTKHKISRIEGLLMLISFITYYAYLIRQVLI